MIARCSVLESWGETGTTHGIRVTRPAGFQFRPVQFVGLELETSEGPVEYSMSLASAPTRDHLEFGVRTSKTPWKRGFAALRPGDEVEIDGPYGHFILDEARPAVMLAGGIGITPLKGMAEYAADRRLPIDVTLLYSSKVADDIAYARALQVLAAANPRFRIIHTLTGGVAPATWKGRLGRIDERMIHEAAGKGADPCYYLCGKPAMVEHIVRLLRSAGVDAASIVHEAFWGYE